MINDPGYAQLANRVCVRTRENRTRVPTGWMGDSASSSLPISANGADSLQGDAGKDTLIGGSNDTSYALCRKVLINSGATCNALKWGKRRGSATDRPSFGKALGSQLHDVDACRLILVRDYGKSQINWKD